MSPSASPPARAAATAATRGAVLELGGVRRDLRVRPLVMGILNRTRDSFFDGGACLELDAVLARAEQLVADGADILDIGGRAGGVDTEPVSAGEELERVVEAVDAVRARFDVAISVDTQRASVARAASAAGAAMVNDMSGFADPGMLTAVAAAGVAVVATHIRLPPGVPDPAPVYDDVVEDVAAALRRLARRARDHGIAAERIVVDPGLDLGKTWRQSLRLLGAFDRFAALGHPVLVAASNKIFLGRALGLGATERGSATVAACAFAVARGGRILRVHDPCAGRQVADLAAAIDDAAHDGDAP